MSYKLEQREARDLDVFCVVPCVIAKEIIKRGVLSETRHYLHGRHYCNVVI